MPAAVSAAPVPFVQLNSDFDSVDEPWPAVKDTLGDRTPDSVLSNTGIAPFDDPTHLNQKQPSNLLQFTTPCTACPPT